MSLTYADAMQQLREWTRSPSLLNHARAVAAAMRGAAHRYGQGVADEEAWAITGLLHDADYDQWPDEHPRRVVGWLQERGEPEIAHAIAAHYRQGGVPCESTLDKALLACDELTGFVVACCLVRPGGIASLQPASVKKKLKDRAFAAKVDRDDVRAGVEYLRVNLTEHIQMIIDALTPLAEELGICGSKQGG